MDLYGPDNMGRKVGVQCKCVERLTKSDIELEISQAEEFEPPLQALHIATSLPTDAKLQKEVRIIGSSEEAAVTLARALVAQLQ
ncbi:hypothetical protein [Archangium sp.]|uniref:hypothetical protein n=1 Tax=Archangium sp. TaxID=1872627 RepID=UPI00286C87C8|nr:hypothetical protein [Archangium sp.]